MLLVAPVTSVQFGIMFFILALHNQNILASTSLIKVAKIWRIDWFSGKTIFLKSLDMYEIWDFAWAVTVACTQIWTACMPLYAVIYMGTQILLRNAANLPSDSSIDMYRRLQIFVRLTNNCYQNTTTVYILNSGIILCCLCGASMLADRVRAHLHFSEQFFCVVLIVLCYIIFHFGFGFPGQANGNSKVVKEIWKGQLSIKGAQSVQGLVWKRKFIKSCPDIRVYFGSANYFEETTGLAVIKFVIDNTVTLLLLFAG